MIIPVKVTVEWRCPHCCKDFTDTDVELHRDLKTGNFYVLLKCGLCDREFEGETK